MRKFHPKPLKPQWHICLKTPNPKGFLLKPPKKELGQFELGTYIRQRVGCSTARYDLDQLVQWEGVEWLELINFVRATSLNAQNTHTSVLTSQESPDRVNQPCTPVSDRMGWKPATHISFARFTFAIWELFFLHTFLRAQTIFLISGKKFVKIHIIFTGNKNAD